jgi:hypothetical protein
MSAVGIDPSGVLVVGGVKTFPLVLSNGPYYDPSRIDPPPVPASMTTPDGGDALAEVASAGVSLLRTGGNAWSAGALAGQLANQEAWLDAAAARNLHGWVWLGEVPNLPPLSAEDPPSQNEVLLRRIAQRLRGHPGLAAWKGIDEPANVFRPARIAAARLKRAYDVLKQVDPDHPVVIIQSPRSTGDLATYAPALDVTGADVYPIAYPPGLHVSPTPNEDIGVVGDVTTTMVRAARGKPVWTTLQIAWSGVTREGATLRFPTFAQERFMAYQAIVRGARGLVFFGGHITRVGTPPNVRPICTPVDIEHGWNWRFWRRVLRPLLEELSARSDLHPALVAPASTIAATCRTVDASGAVTAQSPRDVEFVVRATPSTVFLIAVKRGGQTIRLQFRLSGTRLAPTGRVLFEPPRTVAVRRAGGASSFQDWLGPYEAHVYRIERA